MNIIPVLTTASQVFANSIASWPLMLGCLILVSPWVLPDRAASGGIAGRVRQLWKDLTHYFWLSLGRLGMGSKKKVKQSLPLESLLLEVAGRLEAGANPQAAWYRAVRRTNLNLEHWPVESDFETEFNLDYQLWNQLQKQVKPGDLGALVGVVTAVRFSSAVGAPLAEVLQQCAGAVAEAAQAADQRRLALTAPATSAKLLSLLPLAGIGLGTILGLDPLDSLFDGGLGTVSGLTGILMMTAGYWWMKKLVERAAK